MREFLTVKEVADILKIPPRTVYGLIQRGELKAVKVGRRIRIPADALWDMPAWEGFTRKKDAAISNAAKRV